MTDHLHRDTSAIRSGRTNSSEGLAPTIWPSSAFVTPSTDAARSMALTARVDRFYGRYGNPSVSAFESAIAELEGAEAARAYASGMGALTGVILGICSTGDHIVAQHQMYSGTLLFLNSVCPRFGIDVTYVDGTDPQAWKDAIRPGQTMMCLAETPANPNLELVDLDEFGKIQGPITVVDSTFATPILQRPAERGAKLVVHSATKAIGGHNDATIGVVAGSSELIDWLWSFSVLHGASASPYDASNALRGIRTLPIRIARQGRTALTLAQFLQEHPACTRVAYPGLASHPQHGLASHQMDGFGGLLTFDTAGTLEDAMRVVESLNIAQMATSLGGPETLVTHPASTTHTGLTPQELDRSGIGPTTIRVSVGLEHPDDLVSDFRNALSHICEGAD